MNEFNRSFKKTQRVQTQPFYEEYLKGKLSNNFEFQEFEEQDNCKQSGKEKKKEIDKSIK